MLIQNHRMEGLSRAYVEAVAAACGLNISHSRWDYGIDLSLSRVFRYPNGRHFDVGPLIDIQLKSSTQPEIEGDAIRYELDAKTYNDLTRPWVQRQILLVLVVLPSAESDWISHREEGLTINGCGYWLSLRGRKPTKNKRSVTVSIPRTNLFSPQQLQRLVEARIEGKDE